MTKIKGLVRGRVQNVGFRAFVRAHAVEHKVLGRAINLPDGRVEVVLAGEEDGIEKVKKAVAKGPVLSRVDAVVWNPFIGELEERFVIG